jgi:putative oxidoreductase
MKRLLSIDYSALAFNIALLLLRVGFGVLMIPNGYNKLVHFGRMKGTFMNFLGIGSTTSLVLVIFAEFFCAALIVIGLFSRLAAIPLVIAMGVVVSKAHNYDVFGKGEHGLMFLLVFLVILLVGPGKASVDGMINR